MAKTSGVSRLDDFSQIINGNLVESVAGTLAFSSKIETGYSLGDDLGLVLHRIEYHISRDYLDLMLDNNDYINGGMVTSNQITSFTPINPAVIDRWTVSMSKYGTPASAWPVRNPILEKDWTNLPGGGLLVAPNPLYMAVQGISMASVVGYYYRIFFTTVKLSEKGYRELWEMWNQMRV